MQDTNGDKVVLPPVIRPKLKPTSKSPVPAFTPCLLAGSKKISIVTKKKLLYLKSKSSHFATSISLQIRCLKTSLWLIPLVDFLLNMDESLILLALMEATFTIMLLPVLFGLKISYPQDPVKQSKGRKFLSSVFGSKCVFRYLTFIVTTVFLCLVNSVWTVTTNIKSNIPLELKHRIIMQDHKYKFKLSCIGQEHLWFTLPCIGHIMGQMTSPYGPFTSSIPFGCIIALPNYRSGITPLELLTSNKADHRDLSRSHVWGCPVFVLDPKLQNDQNIPKWYRHCCLGKLIGFSEHHYSLIGNVCHLKTGHISPQ